MWTRDRGKGGVASEQEGLGRWSSNQKGENQQRLLCKWPRKTMLYILMRPRGAFLLTCSEGKVSKQGREGEGLSCVLCRSPGEPGEDMEWRNASCLFRQNGALEPRRVSRSWAQSTGQVWLSLTHPGTRWCPLEAKANTEDTLYLPHFLPPALCSVFLAA